MRRCYADTASDQTTPLNEQHDAQYTHETTSPPPSDRGEASWRPSVKPKVIPRNVVSDEEDEVGLFSLSKRSQYDGGNYST